jgi:hypothetical protein
MTPAKDILASRTASAVALCRAADVVLGDHLGWEPESIWIDLDRQGVTVPAEARDRLMAAVALRLVPAFYWDAMVTASTAAAFDGRPAHVEILEEASPGALAWAMVEAAWIRRRHDLEALRPEHEPIAYVAVILDRAGFALAPEQLSFAQEALDARRPRSGLLDDVRQRWSSVDKTRLADLALQEGPVDVQVARLAAIELHVRSRRASAESELARLT